MKHIIEFVEIFFIFIQYIFKNVCLIYISKYILTHIVSISVYSYAHLYIIHTCISSVYSYP